MIPQRTISSTLTHLKLTSLTYIDVSLLRLVSSSFPSLLRLHLSCTERILHTHCWGCYEESLQCVMHSPIPDVFPTQMDLMVSLLADRNCPCAEQEIPVGCIRRGSRSSQNPYAPSSRDLPIARVCRQ